MDIDARSPVRLIMDRELVTVDDHITLRDLAKVLDAEVVGAALIPRDDGHFGIVSERDVVRALAEGADPDQVWVADVMTDDLVTAGPEEHIVAVAMRLVGANIRHVVVVEDQHPVGVVSGRDLLPIVTEDLLDNWNYPGTVEETTATRWLQTAAAPLHLLTEAAEKLVGRLPGRRAPEAHHPTARGH